MTKPLKKRRDSRWNYGGPNWKLSRSKIDYFIECPRCFYLDNKIGVKRPDIPAFLLNSAVDALLKKEFDIYRAKQEPHPLMVENKIDAIPFEHPELETWRENFEGVQYMHEPTGMMISGAVDDLWINPNNELYVVDYKSTSSAEPITLDGKWKEAYKRQMAIYQWLLRQRGFEVSDTGYFVYANALITPDAFDACLTFDMQVLPYEGDTSWIDDTLFQIKDVLEGDTLPESGAECDHCASRYARDEVEK